MRSASVLLLLAMGTTGCGARALPDDPSPTSLAPIAVSVDAPTPPTKSESSTWTPPACTESGWVATSGIPTLPRDRPGVTELPDGRLLIVGGRIGRADTGSAEFFDPVSTRFHIAPSLPYVLTGAPALAMNGPHEVIATGPQSAGTDGAFAAAFVIKTNRWEFFEPPAIGVIGATPHTLSDGRIVFVGSNGIVTFDPATRAFRASPLGGYSDFSSALLLDGRILIVRDTGGCGKLGCMPTPPLIYDPSTETLTEVPGPDGGVLATMPDGRVLRLAPTEASFYEPTTGTWSAAKPPPDIRATALHVLPCGRVIAVGWTADDYMGGSASYDPVADRWTRIATTMGTPAWSVATSKSSILVGAVSVADLARGTIGDAHILR